MKPAIGILGGTFSPIHYGHLRPAEQVRRQLGLAEIRLLPCHRPPHREQPGVSAKMRAEMCRLACEEYPHFDVDTRELERDGPSYSVLTLTELRQEIPDTPLCFLMGMDSLLSFKTWHRWQEILSLSHLVVSCRPGWQLDQHADIADVLNKHRTDEPKRLHTEQAGLIYLAQIDEQAISSTDIRTKIRDGQSVTGLLPKAVSDYIAEHHLYHHE